MPKNAPDYGINTLTKMLALIILAPNNKIRLKCFFLENSLPQLGSQHNQGDQPYKHNVLYVLLFHNFEEYNRSKYYLHPQGLHDFLHKEQ
jgi:hypothetical protein